MQKPNLNGIPKELQKDFLRIFEYNLNNFLPTSESCAYKDTEFEWKDGPYNKEEDNDECDPYG